MILYQQQRHLFPRTRIVRRISIYKISFQDSGHSRNSLIPSEQDWPKKKRSANDTYSTFNYLLTRCYRQICGSFTSKIQSDGFGRIQSKGSLKVGLRNCSNEFSNNSTFQQLYFLEKYKKMGRMIEVDSSDYTPFVHYLPHNGILWENSRTTKLRVVFNGSSRTSNGLSLNDILHADAKLQTDMCDILLWTRTHKVLFSTNIVKIFCQIAVCWVFAS